MKLGMFVLMTLGLQVSAFAAPSIFATSGFEKTYEVQSITACEEVSKAPVGDCSKLAWNMVHVPSLQSVIVTEENGIRYVKLQDNKGHWWSANFSICDFDHNYACNSKMTDDKSQLVLNYESNFDVLTLTLSAHEVQVKVDSETDVGSESHTLTFKVTSEIQ